MTVSVVIPYYEVNAGKIDVLTRCVQSLRGQDEIIVVWNDKMGYAPAINRGWKCSRGEFVIVMNDDVWLKEGNLKDLCVAGHATSPTYDGNSYEFIWGSCFCLPRDVFELIGGMDERYRVSYFDDDDLIKTLQLHNIPFKTVKSVDFGHTPATTLESMPDRNVFFEENRIKFNEKWNESR